jgi:hypothetical protein
MSKYKRGIAALAAAGALLVAGAGVASAEVPTDADVENAGAAAGPDAAPAEANCLATTITGIAGDPIAAVQGTLADPGATVTGTLACATSLL